MQRGYTSFIPKQKQKDVNILSRGRTCVRYNRTARRESKYVLIAPEDYTICVIPMIVPIDLLRSKNLMIDSFFFDVSFEVEIILPSVYCFMKRYFKRRYNAFYGAIFWERILLKNKEDVP